MHHSSNEEYLDKNFGDILIIWDKLFGTFQKELPESEYQPLRYGLTTNIEKPNAVSLVFHEWNQIAHDVKRKDLTLGQKLGYLFRPPGWSHDGSRHTSNQMREQELKKEPL